MYTSAEWLLIGAVAAVGVLHTIVPDHWVPITLVARQRRWTIAQTVRAALTAGTGHVVSTLIIAIVVWIAGVAVAKQFGGVVDTLASVALIGFGGWIAVGSLLDMRRGGGHGHLRGHAHGHSHGHADLTEPDATHGPESEQFDTHDGPVTLSIYETGRPPHFRVTGGHFDRASLVTLRPDGARQAFTFENVGGFWQSTREIPEPHAFDVTLTLAHGDHEHDFNATFAEHQHYDQEHGHGHGGNGHSHHHHAPRGHGSRSRVALLLILGSSPMVEGIPAFFAASRYGVGLIIVMSLIFAAATILTYVALCAASVASLKRLSLGPIERYGEVLSGAFIALVGVAFWIWPLL